MVPSILSFVSHSDIDFSISFGPPVSFLQIPSLPNTVISQDFSLCFAFNLHNVTIGTFQNIFQLYDTTNCQLAVAMQLDLVSIVIKEGSTNTTLNSLNNKGMPTPICFRRSVAQNKWSLSVRANEIGSENLTIPITSQPSSISTTSLNLGGPEIDDQQEVCSVSSSSSQRSLNGKLFYLMFYSSFISDEAVQNNMNANWHIDDSLFMTMYNLTDFTNIAHGNVTRGEIFSS